MTEPVVVTQQLTKHYGQLVALDQLSIVVGRGQVLGLIGPNGAGKTTAIKILVGLARPTSGTASIAGVDCVRQARRIKHLVGYMPDRFGPYDNMRVREYLDFFAAAFRIPWRKRRQRIDEVLETTATAYMQDRFVATLSHGMQQRIGIARTLLHDPQVLILDEPANGLDPQARIEMRHLLLQLAALGKTLIVTSHILPELARICDRVAILTNGRLRAAGSVDEIMQQVRQQRLIEVLLPSPDHVERTAAVLRERLGQEAEITPAASEAAVRFNTRRTEEGLGEILADLVRDGIPVSQFREVVSDLEDAFLSVTGTGERSPASVTAV